MLPPVPVFVFWLVVCALGSPLDKNHRHPKRASSKFITERSPSIHRQMALAARAATLQKFRTAPALLAGQGTSPGYNIPSSLQNAYNRASDHATNISFFRSLSKSSANSPAHSSFTIKGAGSRTLDSTNNTILNPLSDDTDGVDDYEYYGPLAFGSQAQQLQVDIDTGSADLWAPIDGCDSCQGLKHFDANASSTFRNSTLPFEVVYGSGAVTGFVVQDIVALGSYKVANQTFGAVRSVSPNLANGPNDGLIGLAFSTIANTRAPTFFENIIPQLSAPLFSVYMARGQTRGSEVCFGCVDSSKAKEQAITWVPLVSKTYWTVEMVSVSVNNASVPSNKLNALIDTGTSFIYVPAKIASAIYARIPGSVAVPEYGEGFYAYPCDDQVQVSFDLGGNVLPMDPRDMNIGKYPNDPTNKTCIGAIISSGSSRFDFAILGDSFCKKYVTVFDYSHGARVGFLESIDG